MLQRGQKITVFQDPLTCKTPEGDARLIQFIEKYHDGLERWQVRFLGEKEKFERLIDPENVYPA
mgnify:CR=1 FL=1|jgi:hypothetical protein